VKDLVDYALVRIREKKECWVRSYCKGHLPEFIEIKVYSIPHSSGDMYIQAIRTRVIVVVIFHDHVSAETIVENTALLYFHSRNHAERLW